ALTTAASHLPGVSCAARASCCYGPSMSEFAASAHAGLRVPTLLRYPEQRERREPWLERAAGAVEASLLARATRARTRRLAPIVAAAAQHTQTMAALDDVALAREARSVGNLLKRDANWPEYLVARAFAVIREAAGRTIGQRHYDVQLIGGYAVLRGMIA